MCAELSCRLPHSARQRRGSNQVHPERAQQASALSTKPFLSSETQSRTQSATEGNLINSQQALNLWRGLA